MVVAYESFIEFEVGVSRFPDSDGLTVVEVDDVFAHFSDVSIVAGFVSISEHHKRRVDESITVNNKFFPPIEHSLFDLFLADLAAEVVLEILIAVRSPGSWARGYPTFQTVVMAELYWPCAFADIEQGIIGARVLTVAVAAKFYLEIHSEAGKRLLLVDAFLRQVHNLFRQIHALFD